MNDDPIAAILPYALWLVEVIWPYLSIGNFVIVFYFNVFTIVKMAIAEETHEKFADLERQIQSLDIDVRAIRALLELHERSTRGAPWKPTA